MTDRPEAVPDPSPSHLAELEKRAEEARLNPKGGTAWDVVRAGLEQRLSR
jgi:hypothetical protein